MKESLGVKLLRRLDERINSKWSDVVSWSDLGTPQLLYKALGFKRACAELDAAIKSDSILIVNAYSLCNVPMNLQYLLLEEAKSTSPRVFVPKTRRYVLDLRRMKKESKTPGFTTLRDNLGVTFQTVPQILEHLRKECWDLPSALRLMSEHLSVGDTDAVIIASLCCNHGCKPEHFCGWSS